MQVQDWLKGLLATAAGVLSFEILFWDQGGLGANVSLYAVVMITLMLLLHRKKKLQLRQYLALAVLLFTSSVYVLKGTELALCMLFISAGVHIVLFHESRIRSLVSVLPQLLFASVLLPFQLRTSMGVPMPKGLKPVGAWRWAKLMAVPIAVFAVYVGIYQGANPKFDQLTAGLFEGVANAIWTFLSSILTAHTLFVMLGLGVSILFLFRLAPDFMASVEARSKDIMERVRVKRPDWMDGPAMNALEKERRMGIILLVMMNALLLLVNCIDISWIWFGFEVPEGFDLKQFVHAGTWLLILSIGISIVILLFLFRRNQNFHPKRRPLQLLAIAWIVQNFVLGISVFMRNYHYINFHGLAEKRIGVMLFLALVLFGLYTMVLKIRDKRTGFNLLMLNSWAAFLLLVAASAVDWDRRIVETNLNHSNPAEIDVDHYLAMDPRTYPLLYEHLDRVDTQIVKHRRNNVRWIEYQDIREFEQTLDQRSKDFMSDYEKRGEWALTYDMKRTYEALKGRQ